MQTTKAEYPDEIISAGQLLRILDSDAREVSMLCQKACLKPKKDGFGNIYFSKGDVDVLRKVKELYEYTRKLQEDKKQTPSHVEKVTLKENKLKKPKLSLNLPELPKSGEEIQAIPADMAQNTVLAKIENLENNIVSRITGALSEKLDGLDEVIVELIKAKTENETLRQKVNELNKENFALKTENSSYKAVGLGFYVKKQTDEFSF